MGTILSFTRPRRDGGRQQGRDGADRAEAGELVIFPGVRIERYSVDLGYRLRDTAGRGQFDEIGGKHRPRKTS
jgi:hypothetical protein